MPRFGYLRVNCAHPFSTLLAASVEALFLLVCFYNIFDRAYLLKQLTMINPNELTQCLNLARALDLITSSRIVAGRLYVYNAAGYSKTWDSFMAEYPLERLQAMVQKAKS